MITIEQLARQIKRVEKKIEKKLISSARYSWARLIISIFAALFVLLALFYTSNVLSWIAFALFFTAFIVLAVLHHRVKRRIALYRLFKRIKQDHINRKQLKWDVLPHRKEPVRASHPFANDLNISGEFSLYRLLNNTATGGGADYLLRWLSDENPQYAAVVRRQQLVKELTPLFRFRDKLSFYAQCNDDKPFNGSAVLERIDKNSVNKIPRRLLTALILLAGINIVLFGAFYYQMIPAYFSVSFIIYLGLFLANGRYIKNLLDDAADLSDEFRKISKVIKFIEKFNFRQKTLFELTVPVKKEPPSADLRRMTRLLTFIGLRANPLVQVAVNLIFPVDYLLNYLLLKQESALSKRLPQWLDVWYRLDALSALAGFAWRNSDYIFPEIFERENSDDIILQTAAIGHPLIPAQKRITNDFTLSKGGEIALITGSNMSGKSTFLRTIGVNAALAYAGGPVCAVEFRLRLLRLLTCINISDSLGEGISYFYAEVKRLKLILEQQQPVFFLIDEIYRGTNNRERLIGSKAVIKALAQKNDAGIISTHDLELTTMEKEIKKLNNYHFRDNVSGGKMTFDYKLHDGPCPTTNALKIMKAEGLPIE